jgi:hypothetical protein
MKKLLINLAMTIALVGPAHAADEPAAVMKDRIEYCHREAKKFDIRVGPRWRNKSRPVTKKEYENAIKSCMDNRWWDDDGDDDQ